MTFHMIGAGGTGSYLFPVLQRYVVKTDSELRVWDGDRVEAKNLERQQFSKRHISYNKAIALVGGSSHCAPVTKFYKGIGEEQIDTELWFICCADNHAARLACIKDVDIAENRHTIIAGNSTDTAEAYYYHTSLRGTNEDPRVKYPVLLEHDPFDPTKERCNSEKALAETPQLAHVNMMAASLIMKLLWIHRELKPLLDERAKLTLATHFISTPYGWGE